MKKVIIICVVLFSAYAINAQNRLSKKDKDNQTQESGKFQQEFKITDLAPVQEKGKWGYMQFGEWVINPRFEDAGIFDDGLAPVKMGGKWGFVDKTGKNAIAYKYEDACSYSFGLARVKLYGKWGFIDKAGNTVIPFKYDTAQDFEDGLAQVSLAGKNGYVDKTGEWFDTKQDMMSSFSAFARHYVENDINEWQRKGKYEKLAQWQSRVTDANRKVRIDSLVGRAKEEFIAAESKKINQDYEIVDYDTESEVFLVHDKRFGNLLVPVPIGEAEQFESSFQSVHRFDTYCVNGDNLGLAQAVFSMPTGKDYLYTNDASLAYAQVDIDYNFEAVNFELDEQQVQGNQSIAARNLAVGQSDVDVKIPEMNLVNENTFALIISNENYKFVSKVPYANADGKTFEDYCLKTLGLPKDHIHRQEDATLGTLMGEVDWITNIQKVFGGEARSIVYYAGHGIPDESTRDAFLLPVDGTGTNTKTAYKLSELYARLSEYPTQSTIVFLDACFSGAQRNGQMLASARGVAIKAKEGKPTGNMIVFSAASGDETAYPYNDKGHGLFSYYLLKKLQESKGEATLGELSDYISDNVSRQAIIQNSKSQTPTTIPADAVSSLWKELKLK